MTVTVTDETRDRVRKLSALGVPQSDIARMVQMSAPTLRKYCRDELDLGSAQATAKVAQSLYEMATGGNVAAAIFWMKARAGWRDRPASEDAAAPGKKELAAEAANKAATGKYAPRKGPLKLVNG